MKDNFASDTYLNRSIEAYSLGIIKDLHIFLTAGISLLPPTIDIAKEKAPAKDREIV